MAFRWWLTQGKKWKAEGGPVHKEPGPQGEAMCEDLSLGSSRGTPVPLASAPSW